MAGTVTTTASVVLVYTDQPTYAAALADMQNQAAQQNAVVSNVANDDPNMKITFNLSTSQDA